MNTKLSGAIGIAVCGALVFASVTAAQQPIRRGPGSAGDRVEVAVALQAGGESYQFGGQGTCTHEPKGYIYAVPAQQWRVEHSEGRRSVALTFWRPTNGSGDMFSLSLSSAGKSHMTSTVKVGSEGTVRGSGNATFETAGKGGTFAVTATAADGTKISGTIRCAGFTAAIAEGGN